MDIFGAVRSWYTQVLTEAAFDINVCVQDQSKEDCLKNMVSAIRRYSDANECLKVVDALERNYKGDPNQSVQAEPEQSVNEG